MAYRDDTYSGGFNQPVFDSQATFKQVMDAMARPGSILEITVTARPPAPMGPAAGAIALTLADHDTPVHLSPAMIEAGVQSWLAFHTGALVTDERSEAAFAFVEAGGQMPPLSTFATGTQDYPDRSTTLVLELADLTGGEPLGLKGPGIDSSTEIAPVGLPQHFDCMWTENAALFPRGVDLILVAGTKVLCLPRTTNVTRKRA
jgi:alpha-D-ribose 1-methylphosphonate 5-triphosphate synthase subunit PhnH